MSIWYYFLVVIGSIIVGGVIGFIAFFMITYISDFFLKRKQKKQTALQMAKPFRVGMNEKEVLENERTIQRDDDEFREYEKLRAITKGERGVKPKFSEFADNRGVSERGQISSKFNFNNESKKPITRTDRFEFKKD